MTSPDEPASAFEQLRLAWWDHVREAALRDPALTPEAWAGSAAEHILGLALEGPSRQPCLRVTSPRAAEGARRFARRCTDAEVLVRAVASTAVKPFRPSWAWGRDHAFPGEVVGGKSFHRRDGGRNSGGTIAVALRRRTGAIGLLSNMHTLAPSLGGCAGPRELDLMEATDGRLFGRVASWKQITTRWRRWPNLIDAGAAELESFWQGRVRVGEVAGVGLVTGMAAAVPGDRVLKRGGTTGLTMSRVVAVSVTSRIAYQWDGHPDREFVVSDAVEAINRDARTGGPYAMPGDSGGPVLKRTPEGWALLGLHFAANAERGLFCPVGPAVEALGLELPDSRGGARSAAGEMEA